LGSNVVSELLGLFDGDGLSELGDVGSIWTGREERRDHCVMLSPTRSRRPSRRACQFVHRFLKFLNKVRCRLSFRNWDATTAIPVAMTVRINSSIHHFDNFVGLAGNGGASGTDGRGAAISGALLGAGIDTVETTFDIVLTISGGLSGGTGGAGGGLSLGSGRVATGGGDCLAQCNRSLERPGLP
jgi:hypothetical protein